MPTRRSRPCRRQNRSAAGYVGRAGAALLGALLIIIAITAMTGARAYAATDPPVRPPTQGGTACLVSTDVSDLTTGVVIHGSSFTVGNVARISIGTAALAWIVVPSSGKFDVTVAMPATLTGVQMLRVADARCSFTLRFDASAVPQSLSNPPASPPSPLPQRVTGAGLTIRIFAAIIAGVILIGLCLLFLASRYGRRRPPQSAVSGTGS